MTWRPSDRLLLGLGAVVLVVALYMLVAAIDDQAARQAVIDETCSGDSCPQAALNWVPTGIAHVVGLGLVFTVLYRRGTRRREHLAND